MQEITMPKLSDSMEEGRIVQWLKKEGDRVSEGDIIAEIESDKAVMELESFYAGTIQKIIHKADDVVPVGEVIAVVAEAGEIAATKKLKPEPKAAKPEAAPEPEPVELKATKAAPERAPVRPKGERIVASPLARTLAQQRGIDLAQVKGSGPSGRIVKRDVLAAVQKGAAKAPAKPAVPAAPAVAPAEALRAPAAAKAPDEELPPISLQEGEAEIEPASYWQLSAARRTVASKHVIPHFYLTNTVNATRLLELKTAKKAELGATLTHYLIRACVKALERFPQANWSYDRGKVVKWKHVHIGLAVQAEAGLVVAVLHKADEMSLKQIVSESAPLVEHARRSRLSPQERLNPTFTISNLGMFDVDSFMAIINPPSACTLAVGSVVAAPIVTVDRAIAVADVMKLTLSADHRLIDGVLAANLMAEIKRLLEHPEELLG